MGSKGIEEIEELSLIWYFWDDDLRFLLEILNFLEKIRKGGVYIDV